jgi:hypothetical protein
MDLIGLQILKACIVSEFGHILYLTNLKIFSEITGMNMCHIDNTNTNAQYINSQGFKSKHFATSSQTRFEGRECARKVDEYLIGAPASLLERRDQSLIAL